MKYDRSAFSISFIFVWLRLNVDECVSAEALLRVGDVRLRRPGVPRVQGHQLRDDVDGDREHNGAVVLRRDAVQGLEIPSMMFSSHLGS